MADELGLLDLSLFEVEYKYPIVMAIEIGKPSSPATTSSPLTLA
jgi:hypothetical protein